MSRLLRTIFHKWESIPVRVKGIMNAVFSQVYFPKLQLTSAEHMYSTKSIPEGSSLQSSPCMKIMMTSRTTKSF